MKMKTKMHTSFSLSTFWHFIIERLRNKITVDKGSNEGGLRDLDNRMREYFK